MDIPTRQFLPLCVLASSCMLPSSDSECSESVRVSEVFNEPGGCKFVGGLPAPSVTAETELVSGESKSSTKLNND